MNNYESYPPDDDIEQLIEREEILNHYLNVRDLSYDELIGRLEKYGGKIAFHDSERLIEICSTFTAGTIVEFSEQQIPGDYQSGILVDDAFLLPLSTIDRPQNIYRPQLCATIQDHNGVIDTLLFPIRRRSDDTYIAAGLKVVDEKESK